MPRAATSPPTRPGLSFSPQLATSRSSRSACASSRAQAVLAMPASAHAWLQRRPHVHSSENRQRAAACVARRHHRRGAGDGRGRAVFPAAAPERVRHVPPRTAPPPPPPPSLPPRPPGPRNSRCCSYGDALRSLSSSVAGYGQFFSGPFPAQCRQAPRRVCFCLSRVTLQRCSISSSVCYQRECTHEPSSCPLPALSSNLQPLVSAAFTLHCTAASPRLATTLSHASLLPLHFALSPALQRRPHTPLTHLTRYSHTSHATHTPHTPLTPLTRKSRHSHPSHATHTPADRRRRCRRRILFRRRRQQRVERQPQLRLYPGRPHLPPVRGVCCTYLTQQRDGGVTSLTPAFLRRSAWRTPCTRNRREQLRTRVNSFIRVRVARGGMQGEEERSGGRRSLARGAQAAQSRARGTGGGGRVRGQRQVSCRG